VATEQAPPDGRVKLGWSRFLDPHVEDRLIAEEGEYVIDEIRRHWVTRLWPGTRVVLGMAAFGVMPWLGHLWWIATLAGLGLGINGFWRMHTEYMDRFVVTDFRVFRVHGVMDQTFAMMPISRVLDISMQRPFWGQILGYATFTFETAAQDQGMREIKYVGDPDQRLHDFAAVIAKAGLGGRVQGADIASGD
jgi:PH (Pleckstrin Homology) domain-containing protein